jgi:hypothetical protein
MHPSPYTRLLFAYLIPGAALVCAILFLAEVPVEEGYRISLLEWTVDSDRAFPYVVALGLVASAVLGSITQAVRTLLVDGWALPRAAAPPGPQPGVPEHPAGTPWETALAAAPDAAEPAWPAAPPGRAARGPARGRTVPGPLAELHGNLALALLATVLWVSGKILRGGGTEVFPRRVAYGVPLVGLAACALLLAAYRSAGGQGTAE